jgi:hypothetical protein
MHSHQQLQEMFRIGREQVGSFQLIERGVEEHKPVLYIWLIAITVGIAVMIAAAKPQPFVRGQLRTPGPSPHEGSKLTPPHSAG